MKRNSGRLGWHAKGPEDICGAFGGRQTSLALVASRLSHEGATLPTIRPASYNYDLPTCDPRTMANFARTSMLINKRRFSHEHFIDFFGGGIR
jgi:hypothetical protein